MPTALIVDDKPENLYLLEVLLKGHGYQVQTAAHGVEALASARQTPPDILITDILMPVMDGFTLCRQWKQDAALKQIPLVFYTATYTDDKDRQFALSLGADCFIVKPSEPTDFFRIIANVLTRKPDEECPPPAIAPMASEEVYLKEYSQTLIRKLETKVVALETANRAVALVEADLRQLNANLEQRVTERTQELRAAQEQLIHQEKLAVLGQLASSVAHELRNPLGVITNAVYFLNAVQPNADAAVLDYLGLISAEVNNADRIINDLLDFARIKGVARETVDLAALVERVLQKHPPAANITVVSAYPDPRPPLFVDPRQIEQVLTNLVVNACQAMPEGGSLTIRAEVITEPSSASPQPSWVALHVVDTGTGISPENRRQLFEPLFTTKARGIGLGLAVSKKLVEANGGKIEVQSEPGQGSTFTIFLPPKDRTHD